MIPSILFLYGIVIGSFLNVCIYRLPLGESVVHPRSRCPHCHRPIAAFDNIPLLSYLLLRGKCRHCHTPISPLYFFVELLTGLLFVFLYRSFGLNVVFGKYVVLGALLIVLAITDWQVRLLPDRVTFPGMALGLAGSLFVPIQDGAGRALARLAGFGPLPLAWESLGDSVLGALLGAGLLYLLGAVYFRLRHREGMGLGDIKMMAMVGFFLGPKLTLLTIMLGSASGAVLGLVFILSFGKTSAYELPFGTFLSAAALAAAVWGRQLLYWYLGYFS